MGTFVLMFPWEHFVHAILSVLYCMCKSSYVEQSRGVREGRKVERRSGAQDYSWLSSTLQCTRSRATTFLYFSHVFGLRSGSAAVMSENSGHWVGSALLFSGSHLMMKRWGTPR